MPGAGANGSVECDRGLRYLTLVIQREWLSMYDEEDRRALLTLARRSIQSAITGTPPPARETGRTRLTVPAGVFVTLKKRGELRGCIGFIEPYLPLAEAVAEVAVKAALADPRFPPVTASEMSEITIEISVLSPLTRIHRIEELEVGKHGVVVALGFARGLLLPQVATEYGWNRQEFLEHACRKAGLPPSRWKDRNVEIFTFTTEMFSE